MSRRGQYKTLVVTVRGRYARDWYQQEYWHVDILDSGALSVEYGKSSFDHQLRVYAPGTWLRYEGID